MITKTYSQDLSEKNSFGMKVISRCFIEYDSIADLFDMDFEEMLQPVLHIGGGCNLLFTDDFKGTILHSGINFIEELGDGLVSVGAGVCFDDFCKWAADKGLWGPENLSAIPGEVGASAVQNIGAYGAEAKDIIKTVYCYDIVEEDMVHFDVSECGYGYRDSNFKHEAWKGRYIVTHVVFKLKTEAEPKLDYGNVRETLQGQEIKPSNIRKAIMKIRSEKLPDHKKTGNAGSFFKNPVVPAQVLDEVRKALGQKDKVPYYELPDGMVKIPAAFLIEKCGWKGRRSGNAAVHDKQPLVIINATGMATPDEIVALENKVKASVKQKFGITLEPEVEHI